MILLEYSLMGEWGLQCNDSIFSHGHGTLEQLGVLLVGNKPALSF